MAPVHQRIAPLRMFYVAVRALREMALHIADHLAHVCVVVGMQIALLRAEQLDYSPSRLVPDRLRVSILLANGTGFVRREPFLELMRRHVDERLEFIERCFVFAVRLLSMCFMRGHVWAPVFGSRAWSWSSKHRSIGGHSG